MIIIGQIEIHEFSEKSCMFSRQSRQTRYVNQSLYGQKHGGIYAWGDTVLTCDACTLGSSLDPCSSEVADAFPLTRDRFLETACAPRTYAHKFAII
jgi:hypothetical protein